MERGADNQLIEIEIAAAEGQAVRAVEMEAADLARVAVADPMQAPALLFAQANEKSLLQSKLQQRADDEHDDQPEHGDQEEEQGGDGADKRETERHDETKLPPSPHKPHEDLDAAQSEPAGPEGNQCELDAATSQAAWECVRDNNEDDDTEKADDEEEEDEEATAAQDAEADGDDASDLVSIDMDVAIVQVESAEQEETAAQVEAAMHDVEDALDYDLAPHPDNMMTADELGLDSDDDASSSELEPAIAVTMPAFAPSSVPPTISYPVNEMEVVTNRGGRAGSLSKFLDDSDIFRRRSLTTFPDESMRESLHQKTMTLDSFLSMAIDPILEALDDADSDIRQWLVQSDTVEGVLKEFAKPPCFTGEPHEEYGFYKNYFICSEIIMKLYTGEEDLYESFSSDSSSGSAAVNTVFGCQDSNDVHKWELLYSIFDNPAPLDEMQLLFFSKALVRLHDGFCLEDGYVTNVLSRFLPRIMPHMYSSTIKYMLTLILQSYESVHPITGRNDAMEIILPLLVKATHLDVKNQLNPAGVENASHLLVDMLQANQADRLGSFCRREGGVYLSKYFVRDQFGTIRGFESMTHGYHNFLQFMLLEEFSKSKDAILQLFENAVDELECLRKESMKEASASLNVHAATELLCLYKKHGITNTDADTDEESERLTPVSDDFGFASNDTDLFAGSPRPSTSESAMYNLSTLSDGDTLWAAVVDAAKKTTRRFCEQFDEGLPSSVEISVAKHLLTLVQLGDDEIDKQLHEGLLMHRYLRVLERRPTFDMLLIHVTPAIDFVVKDNETDRSEDRLLLWDLFIEKEGVSLSRVLERSESDLPSLKVYADVIKDSIDEVLGNPAAGSETRLLLRRLCKQHLPWTTTSPVSTDVDVDIDSSRTNSAHLAQIQEDAEVTTEEVEDVEDDASAADRANMRRPGSDPTADRCQISQPALRRSASNREPAGTKGEDDEEGGGSRKSGYYLKMLQAPVFRNSMRLGSGRKSAGEEEQPPPPPPAENTTQQRGSFGWNSVLKRLRQSFVTGHSPEKNEKKLLAITHDNYASGMQGAQTEVLVVDTSKGEDVTKMVHRDTRVTVSDVPQSNRSPSHAAAGAAGPNVVTSGFMYKNKLPDSGQRHLWERYYFVLNRTDCSLSYYVSEAHAKDRTFVRGSARLVSVTEGIPVSAKGANNVFGFQINTQGHGAFMVIVDSIDTRLVWLTQILAALNAVHPPPASMKRLSIVANEDLAAPMASPTSQAWTRQQLKAVVTDLYKNLFGPQLRFSTPMDAPASFWMEEKIDPVAESCVLRSNLPDCVPFWGEFHGYKRMCDYWRTRDETIERSSGRVLRIVIDEEEETAVVMTSTTYRILRNSQTVTEESCEILNLSGGVIVSIYCTFDSFRIAEAFQSDGISAS